MAYILEARNEVRGRTDDRSVLNNRNRTMVASFFEIPDAGNVVGVHVSQRNIRVPVHSLVDIIRCQMSSHECPRAR